MRDGRQFRAGDILVACDNVKQIPIGYMGHSAIVVNRSQIVEATDSIPYIRLVPITKFLNDHPIHVHYRPKSAAMGQRAASWAMDYLRQYESHLRNGINRPFFTFDPRFPLHDPWGAIYCSKLVWLCYHYGAGHMFPNDFFLFSPEDLDTCLRKDSRFTTVFRHPHFAFYLDT